MQGNRQCILPGFSSHITVSDGLLLYPINVKKTAVYTLPNGGIQALTHQKQQKS